MKLIGSPLEQFEILPIIKFPFIFTNSYLILIIAFCFILIFFFFKNHFIPSRLQQIIEMIFTNSIELTYSNIGKQGKHFVSLIFVIFFFLILCNVIGMIPYSFTVTSHLIITFLFSLTIYLGFNIIGIKKHKKNFLKILLPSGANIFLVPILVPIELISYLFRVISLPVRLFANMMSGHTLLKVIAGFSWSMLNINNLGFISYLIPLLLIVILIGLELAVALIQAYVFTILICVYINDVINLH
jgi:ATP synthase subunit 6